MAWTLNDRGLSAALPSRLPQSVAPLLEKFTHLVAESKALAQQATEMRRQRERRRSGYEAEIGKAMLDGTKLPVDPMPDYDLSIASLDSRSAGAKRAAASIYGQIGDSLGATKNEDLAALEVELGYQVTEAIEALVVFKPLVDQVCEVLALHRWHGALTPYQARRYVIASQEAKTIDQALGQVSTILRRLSHDLTQRQQEPEPEEVAS